MPEILDPLKRPKKPKTELPHLFGRGGRDRILMSLAVNGPMTVREVGRATNIDSRKAFDMVARLLESGLVVKRDRHGGRKYVAINRNFPAWAELMNLLEAIDARFPVKRVEVIAKRWHLQEDYSKYPSTRFDGIFQATNRSRILLLIAAAGESVEKDIYGLLGLNMVSAMYAINHWQRERIIRSRYVGQCRMLSMDPGWFAAHELRMFLSALIVDAAEYLGLGRIARARAEQYEATYLGNATKSWRNRKRRKYRRR